MAKKTERDEKLTTPDKPRILLKPKESSEIKNNATQISIAPRPVEATPTNVETAKTNRIQQLAVTPTTSKDANTLINSESVSNEMKQPSMKQPFLIVSDHYQVQSHAQDFLIETNTDFIVVGVIGTQGSGKSFILNMLAEDSFDDVSHVNKLINGKSGIFQMRHQLKTSLSNMCCTEGIQMYITHNRTILLDCSPVLCNPYKKEAILNELDDLKLLVFMLNVCNSLIVVEDCGFNMHLMRLLLTAESMKIDVYESDDRQHSPNILLFKNKCQNHDFLEDAKINTANFYTAFFECSGLKTTQIHSMQERKSIADDPLDIFYFPWIQENGEICSCFLLFHFLCFFFF